MLDSVQQLFDRLNELAANNPELKEISDRLHSSLLIQEQTAVQSFRKVMDIGDRVKFVKNDIKSNSNDCKKIKKQLDEVIDFISDKKR